MTFKRNSKIDVDLIEGIFQFESNKYYQKYLNEDGSLNEKGLHELRSIRSKPFNWNDRKWIGYEDFHLGERVKSKWIKRLKKKQYYSNDDYFNTWLIVRRIRDAIKHDLTHKECKKCKGHGVIFNTGKIPNPKCIGCKGKGEIKI